MTCTVSIAVGTFAELAALRSNGSSFLKQSKFSLWDKEQKRLYIIKTLVNLNV